MMKYADINKLSTADLEKKIAEKQKELVNLRFQMVSNQVKDVKVFQKTRREIAQMMTAINSKKKG